MHFSVGTADDGSAVGKVGLQVAPDYGGHFMSF
jgi:hypothetical protein